ncbi:unnamed protein product [Rhodiola kirilowii]
MVNSNRFHTLQEADELLAQAGYVQTHGYIWIPPTL